MMHAPVGNAERHGDKDRMILQSTGPLKTLVAFLLRQLGKFGCETEW
jgi:hypothetical protein